MDCRIELRIYKLKFKFYFYGIKCARLSCNNKGFFIYGNADKMLKHLGTTRKI